MLDFLSALLGPYSLSASYVKVCHPGVRQLEDFLRRHLDVENLVAL